MTKYTTPKDEASIMDKQPKRRVLSLSLSQPGKQHKRTSKLKRHVSATSDHEVELSVPEYSQEVSKRRNENLGNFLSQSISQPTLSLKTLAHGPSSHGVMDDENKGKVQTHKVSSKGICEEHVSHSPPGRQEEIELSSGNSESVIASSSPVFSEELPARQPGTVSRPTNSFDNPSTQEFKCTTDKGENDSQCISLKSSKKIVTECCPPKSLESILRTKSPIESDIDYSHSKDTSSVSKCINTEFEPSNRAEEVGSFIHEDSKPTDVDKKSDVCKKAEILQCPLCYKTFEKLTTKTSHLKGCASKHKMSTQQLLEALELQQRQAEERRALGLPGIPSVIGNVKKSTGPKKENRSVPKMDSGLQLAMALSLSLQDQEKQALYDYTVERESTKVISLDHFGFTSKSVLNGIQPRPLPSSSSSSRGKMSKKPTPTLLTRTIEDRQRIITEKVAMVLLEEVELGKGTILQKANLQSSFLQELQDKETLLWKKSYLSPTKEDRESYYVKDLREFISPSKVKAGSKLLHLSQVAGRLNSPSKITKQPEVIDIPSVSPSDEDMSSDSCSQKDIKSANLSHIEMELRAKLFNDWAGMVNNSSMSDLAVYPKEGRDIPVHKTIFHVRCPRILQDISKQRNLLTGNEVEVIMWSKTPHAAALAFLEYVYCGSVKSIRALSSDLSSIIWLANHYKIADLLRYLRAVNDTGQSSETPSQVALNAVCEFDETIPPKYSHQEETENPKESKKNKVTEPTVIEKSDSESQSASQQKVSRKSDSVFTSPAGTPSRSDADSIYSEITLPGIESRSVCSSPDMFCDDEFQKCQENISEDARDLDIQSENTPSLLADHISLRKSAIDNSSNISRPQSQCESISSDKTIVFEKSSIPLSHVLSNASNQTKMIEVYEHESPNDCKRKYSNCSLEDNLSSSKRLCSANPGLCHEEKEVEDVVLLDLTQDTDSNSNTSFPIISENFSGNSSGKVSALSGDDLAVSNSKSKKEKSVDERRLSEAGSERLETDSTEVLSAAESPEPYISPVWDGFEDMNFDEPFFTQPLVNPESPTQLAESPAGRTPSPSLAKDFVNQSVKSTPFQDGKFPDKVASASIKPATLLKESSSNKQSSLEALLDDSFDVNDSILRQAETGFHGRLSQRHTKGTPVNRILSAEQDTVTPLANYSIMETPQLKRELQKFGLKPSLGKRKGKIMLRHIYDELHPWVPAESDDDLRGVTLSQPSCSLNNDKSERNTLPSSQPVNSKKLTFPTSNSDSAKGDCETDESCSSDDESVHEGQFLEDSYQELEPLSQALSQHGSEASLPKVVFDFIMNDRHLHKKVLEYEPIWIEELQSDLRNNGHKFKINDLMAFLDEKCITFRTAQKSRVKKRKKRLSNSRKKVAKGPDTNDLSE